MATLIEELRKVPKSEFEGNWKDKVRFRNQNKAWLRKSSAIALKILDALDVPEWNQARLARELKVSPQVVSKWVKGHENFTLETLCKIEAVLGIELITILKEDETVMKRQEIDSWKKIQSTIFKQAFEKEKVINSGGGTYVSSKAIESTLKELSKKDKSSTSPTIGESNYAMAC